MSVRHPRPAPLGRLHGARQFAGATLLLNAPYTGSATTANRYRVTGATCVTAGNSATPSTSVPACGSAAPQDANGAGALQLTQPLTNQFGFLVTNPTFPTSGGLVITFTDYSFGGSSPSADGTVFFLTDASQAEPTTGGQPGGSLGYANGTNTAGASGPGTASAYLGVGLDEFGNFSNPTEGRNGGPGQIPETVAIRGAASTGWTYLTGGREECLGQSGELTV